MRKILEPRMGKCTQEILKSALRGDKRVIETEGLGVGTES